jgi:hypothetical protein
MIIEKANYIHSAEDVASFRIKGARVQLQLFLARSGRKSSMDLAPIEDVIAVLQNEERRLSCRRLRQLEPRLG